MITAEHRQHVASRVSHNACPECRADNQRSFARGTPFKYDHVHEYLSYVKPRLIAIQTGEQGGSTLDARWWYERFVTALHRRISTHNARQGRKYSDGYLERLRMATRSNVDVGYLREFSRRGACCL
jgi:hypothetical protein